MTKHKCADCGGVGVLRAGPLGWLCVECATKRVNSPENMALTEADAEIAEHLESGGKLS